MIEFEHDIEQDDPGPDFELAEALAFLDPASSDPTYWLRFRAGVMGSAARELAQRRLLAQLTVTDVMRSWARAVVPTALATAILAGALLIRGGAASTVSPVGLEELLVSEIDGETIPVMLDAEEAEAVVFASAIF